MSTELSSKSGAVQTIVYLPLLEHGAIHLFIAIRLSDGAAGREGELEYWMRYCQLGCSHVLLPPCAGSHEQPMTGW